MAELLDNCRFTAGSTGTADFSDGPADASFRNLEDAGAEDGKLYPYKAQNATGSEWEIGRGTALETSGGWVLERTSIQDSSNGGSAVDFSSPPKVIVTVGKAEIVSLVVGPSSSVSDNLAAFDGTTGKLLKDSGVPSVFTQAGDDAVARSWLSKMQDVVNIRDFGAVGDGETDDTAAFLAAAARPGDIQLCFPAGRYVLTEKITFTDKNVSLVGGGEGVTHILFDHVDAEIEFIDTYNGLDSLQVKRFSTDGITYTKNHTTTAGNGGRCMHLTWGYTGVTSHIDHARFSNGCIQGNGSTMFWNEGIRTTDGGCIRFSNFDINNITPSANAYAGWVIERKNASNLTGFRVVNMLIHNFQHGVVIEHKNATVPGTLEGFYFNTTEIFGCRNAFYDDNDTEMDHIINGLHYADSHAGCSRSLYTGGYLTNLYVTNCNFTMSNTGQDGSAGGVPWITASLVFRVVEISGNRFFRNTSNTTTATCIALPGDNAASGIKLYGNVFENWAAPIDLISGSMDRTMAAAWIGPNTLVSSGSYGALGVITDWINGPHTIKSDYSSNLMRFSGPSSGYTFNGRVRPQNNDGGALGAPTVGWSDLFVADGGVINWANGDVTITHSTNALSFAGASNGYTFDVPIDIASGGTGASTARGAARNIGSWHVLATSAVPVSHTGNTSHTTLATVVIPAGAMGPNGVVRVTTCWSYPSSANSKTLRTLFAGVSYQTINAINSASMRLQVEVHNVNSESSQKGAGIGVQAFGTSSAAPATSTADTTSAQNVTITVQLAEASETVVLEYYLVEVLYGA